MSFSAKEIERLAAKAEADIAPVFAAISLTCEACTARVLEAFASHRVSEAVFAPLSATATATAAGHAGRRVRCRGNGGRACPHPFCQRQPRHFHALFRAFAPGRHIAFSHRETPYDTLLPAIGEKAWARWASNMPNLPFEENGAFVPEKHTMRLISAVRESRPKAVYIQRSRGYSLRPRFFPTISTPSATP